MSIKTKRHFPFYVCGLLLLFGSSFPLFQMKYNKVENDKNKNQFVAAFLMWRFLLLAFGITLRSFIPFIIFSKPHPNMPNPKFNVYILFIFSVAHRQVLLDLRYAFTHTRHGMGEHYSWKIFTWNPLIERKESEKCYSSR